MYSTEARPEQLPKFVDEVQFQTFDLNYTDKHKLDINKRLQPWNSLSHTNKGVPFWNPPVCRCKESIWTGFGQGDYEELVSIDDEIPTFQRMMDDEIIDSV